MKSETRVGAHGSAPDFATNNENNTSQFIKLICYVCGSEDLSTEKCKVWCRKCHTLIENCSGD